MILGLIPARGGSRGIPRKNIKLLGGKPLIQWTIEAAHNSGVIDRLVVSTEDGEIASVVRRLGEEVLERPQELAADDTPMVDVVAHAIKELPQYEEIVLLQPTTPFRSPMLIDEAVRILDDPEADSAVSVVEVEAKYNPKWQFFVSNDSHRILVPWFNGPWLNKLPSRRQALAASFIRDGGVYAFKHESFTRHGTLYGHDCRALIATHWESLNLDEPEDWAEAERRVASMLTTA